MLIHEMSSGQEFLEVIVADVNGDRHPDGRPKVKGMVSQCVCLKQVTVSYLVQCTLLYFENDAEIFPLHYTWKVAERGFKIAFTMNKLAIIKPCEIILEE